MQRQHNEAARLHRLNKQRKALMMQQYERAAVTIQKHARRFLAVKTRLGLQLELERKKLANRLTFMDARIEDYRQNLNNRFERSAVLIQRFWRD
jgi:hypothetical protein